MKKKIAILFHENGAKKPSNYLISYFADIWREDGNEVIFLFGIKKLVFIDIDKTTGMGTASYALKLKPFDNRRAGGIYSYF
jgi:hypothetical protein